jgi:hypothetical protein
MFVNLGDNLTKVYHERPRDQLSSLYGSDDMFLDVGNLIVTSTLTGSKQWTVVPLPSAYSGTNWPIRVSWDAVTTDRNCSLALEVIDQMLYSADHFFCIWEGTKD